MHTYEALGKYFGFPPCCVQWFLDARVYGTKPWDLTDDQEEAIDNKGFIPCPSCATKVVESDMELKDLIQDRICKDPYPIDEDHKATVKYLNDLEEEGVVLK
jgi:hypothetical protein